ncbi:MAG: hypothetical protein KDB23_30730, partial [Planctomycetales bacterium]|nr:hypothetical protein [Planctomycetales bacterium]
MFVSADALDRRRIPRDLVEICRKAIELQPDARYASIADMRRDLENWLSDIRVSVRYSLTDAFWRTVRRHRSAASVLLVTVIAAFVYVGYQYDLNRRRAEELSQANGELDQAVTSNRQLADQAQRQLNLISERQFSSTLREASTLLKQHDPAGAINLLDNETLCPRSEREFAWNLLRDRIATVRHLADIDAPANVIAFLRRDGIDYAAIGLASGQLTLWRLPEFREDETLFVSPAPITSLAISKAERPQIAIGSRDGSVFVIDADGHLVSHIPAHNHAVNLVRFNNDDSALVTGDRQGQIRTWPKLSSPAGVTFQLDDVVVRYDFTPERQLVAAGGKKRSLWVIDLAVGRIDLLDREWAGAISFVERGSKLAASSFSGHMQFWDTTTETPGFIGESELFDNVVRHYQVVTTPQRRIIAAATQEEGVHLSTSELPGLLPLEVRLKRYDTISLAIANDGSKLSFGHRDNKVSFWNLTPLAPSHSLTLDHGPGSTGLVHSSMAWIDDSPPTIAWGTSDGNLCTWEVGNSHPVTLTTYSTSPVIKVGTAPEIDRIVLAHEDGTAEIWSTT